MSTFPPEIITAAQAAEGRTGVYASVTLAQWALESAFGAHEPKGSNNPFGIKALTGEPFVETMTHEFERGHYVAVPQKFARFANVTDAFTAHGQLLKYSKYYAKARAAGDAKSFANALTGVYATDPHYGAKLIAIMDKFDLYQFDKS